MSPRGIFILLVVLMTMLTACQSTVQQGPEHLPGSETDHNDVVDGGTPRKERFRPYEYTGVPTLKRLIFSDDFQAYTLEKPYLLGYSYEGNYVATVVYDAAKEGYLVEVIDTLTSQTAYEAYVPNVERLTNGDQVNIDLLTTAQESLDMGYRIKVAPVVTVEKRKHYTVPGKGDSYTFQVDDEKDGVFRVTVRDEDENEWVVVSDPAPVQKGREFIQEYTWAVHPQVTDRVNIMVYTKQKGQTVTPYVYTVNTAILDKKLSEQALESTLSKWLDDPNVVYRYPSAVNAISVLAVGGKGEKRESTSPLYAGRVQQFVLLDPKGDVIIHAGEKGVFDKGEQLLSETKPVKHYDVTLVPGVSGSEADLFVVDIFDENGHLRQTLEWRWDAKKRLFQLIRPGGGQTSD